MYIRSTQIRSNFQMTKFIKIVAGVTNKTENL